MGGADFRVARKRLGLTQAALGLRLGVTRKTVWCWERSPAVPQVAVLAVVALERLLVDQAA